MPRGPLAGNHPRAVRAYKVGADTVTVAPVAQAYPNLIAYAVQVNGESRGKLVYKSGKWTRGWYGVSFRPQLMWRGSISRMEWREGAEVILGGQTFRACVDAIPQAVRDGKFPTHDEVTVELEEIDRETAEKEAASERERAERKAAQDRAEADAEARRQESLDGLRSIRDTFGAALSNHERSALIAAIAKFGGSESE